MNAPSTELSLNPFAKAPVVAAPTGASAGALMSREAADTATAMMIARQFPRDQRAAVDRILISCTREGLAEEGLYEYARGGTTITGPSIRLAEELARQWGNISCGVAELTRHGGQSEVMAYAVDLETGFRDEKRFMVRHWRDTKAGGHVITEERDIYEHIANSAARRKRACILSIIPGDVQEAAVKQCNVTLNNKGAVNPERFKAMLEDFEEYGVTQAMIEKRIQRRLDAVTPALANNLRRIYQSLKDGMSSVGDWFETVSAETGEIKPAAAEPPKTVSDAVTAKLKAAAPPAPAKAAAATTSPLVPLGEPIAATAVGPAEMSLEDNVKAWIAGTTSAEQLTATWRTIRKEYIDAELDVPLPVEAAYHERKEAFQGGEL